MTKEESKTIQGRLCTVFNKTRKDWEFVKNKIKDMQRERLQ